jgi:hypothetical protein
MPTEIEIDGTGFLINGRPAYEGCSHAGRRLEGLLLNSRMVQAIFDDECPETRPHWRYPDTGVWDPERNTDEFCAALPTYRAHGLLAVTVGLQGGGSIYTPAIYRRYRNSAFTETGVLKPPYLARLRRVLAAADTAGMVVIVNYFYVQQVRHFPDPTVFPAAAERLTAWLLETGFRNLLVDVANESAPWWRYPAFEPENIHTFIDIVKGTTLHGRRLYVGASSGGGAQIARGRWLEAEDFSLPHGNGLLPDQLRAKIRAQREAPEYQRRPRPVVVNEDSVFIENLDAAIDEYASWGFYCQGYGSDYADRTDWRARSRETCYADLSGYQTLPVNWGLNTADKRAFFGRLREITGGA